MATSSRTDHTGIIDEACSEVRPRVSRLPGQMRCRLVGSAGSIASLEIDCICSTDELFPRKKRDPLTSKFGIKHFFERFHGVLTFDPFSSQPLRSCLERRQRALQRFESFGSFEMHKGRVNLVPTRQVSLTGRNDKGDGTTDMTFSSSSSSSSSVSISSRSSSSCLSPASSSSTSSTRWFNLENSLIRS